MPKPAFQVQSLRPHHDRAGFSCGVEPLDNYLKKQAGQDVKKRVAAVFVLTADDSTISGYYTLSQFSVALGVLPQETARRLPRYPSVPATLIGRRSLTLSKQIASAAVIVDAKDDRAMSFYRKYGFLELPDIPGRLFLPMATVEQLFR